MICVPGTGQIITGEIAKHVRNVTITTPGVGVQSCKAQWRAERRDTERLVLRCDGRQNWRVTLQFWDGPSRTSFGEGRGPGRQDFYLWMGTRIESMTRQWGRTRRAAEDCNLSPTRLTAEAKARSPGGIQSGEGGGSNATAGTVASPAERTARAGGTTGAGSGAAASGAATAAGAAAVTGARTSAARGARDSGSRERGRGGAAAGLAATAAFTALILADLEERSRLCARLSIEFRTDCLSDSYREVARSVPTEGDYAPVRATLDNLTRQLDRIVRADKVRRSTAQVLPGNGAPPRTYQGIRPRGTRKSAEVIAQARDALLRSTPDADPRAVHYRRIAAAFDGNAALLRS